MNSTSRGGGTSRSLALRWRPRRSSFLRVILRISAQYSYAVRFLDVALVATTVKRGNFVHTILRENPECGCTHSLYPPVVISSNWRDSSSRRKQMNVVHLTKICVVLAGFSLMAAGVARASVVEQLDLDAGGANQATITVDDLGFVNCIGACGGLSSTLSPTGAYGTLIVTGTLGQFTIGATACWRLGCQIADFAEFQSDQCLVDWSRHARRPLHRYRLLHGRRWHASVPIFVGVSHTTDVQIMGSTIDYTAFGDSRQCDPGRNVDRKFHADRTIQWDGGALRESRRTRRIAVELTGDAFHRSRYDSVEYVDR